MAGVPAKPKPRPKAVSPAESRTSQPARLPLQAPQCLSRRGPVLALLCRDRNSLWYRVHETNLVSATRWSVQWPEQAPNFHELKIDPEIRGVLRFDESEAAAWTLTSPRSSENAPLAKASGTQVNAPRENTTSCLVYVFRWKPGRNSALLANLHLPHVCLPASGWTQVADNGVRNYAVSGQSDLPFRHFEFQRAFERILRRRRRMPFIVYPKIALHDLFRHLPVVASAKAGRRARIRPACQEAAPNGRELNVFARFWKGAVTWDSRSSKQYSSAASRSPQRMRNRISAIWFVMSFFCAKRRNQI